MSETLGAALAGAAGAGSADVHVTAAGEIAGAVKRGDSRTRGAGFEVNVGARSGGADAANENRGWEMIGRGRAQGRAPTAGGRRTGSTAIWAQYAGNGAKSDKYAGAQKRPRGLGATPEFRTVGGKAHESKGLGGGGPFSPLGRDDFQRPFNAFESLN